MIGAVVAYTLVLRLFGVTAGFGEMLGYLPVIFFGATTPGPMRSVAILLWVILFPDKPGEMTTFGIVQHNFFIFFNATIGHSFFDGPCGISPWHVLDPPNWHCPGPPPRGRIGLTIP